MKKNNAFTLLELLAVILILGIIALIAIPTVNKIIDDSKKGAFETTVNNIVKAIEDACQVETLKDMPITTSYSFSNGNVLPKMNIKGKLPSSGSATVDNNCNVAISVSEGKYKASKTISADKVTVIALESNQQVYSNGTAVYFNPETGTKCTQAQAVSTTGTKTGCMKWYAFNDDGPTSDTINLILDHNTTASVIWTTERYNGVANGPDALLEQLKMDTSSWNGVPTRNDTYSVSDLYANYTINYSTYKARIITANEIARITNNTAFNEATSGFLSWFYFDSNNHTFTKTTPGSSDYAWLFDYTNECTEYGCNKNDISVEGYWTATAIHDEGYYAWGINNFGSLMYDFNPVLYMGDVGGVRPVITIPKSKIK